MVILVHGGEDCVKEFSFLVYVFGIHCSYMYLEQLLLMVYILYVYLCILQGSKYFPLLFS